MTQLRRALTFRDLVLFYVATTLSLRGQLRTIDGDLTSTHSGSTPDVVAAAVNLSSPGSTGSFGSAANPLLVQTSKFSIFTGSSRTRTPVAW